MKAEPDAVAARPRPSPPPSVDALLRRPAVEALVAAHGRSAALEALRAGLEAERVALRGAAPYAFDEAAFLARCADGLAAAARPSLRPVFNLTGTVLHTNLGRALLASEAAEAAQRAMTGAVNLEFDVEEGARGERDSHVESLICRLSGAEAAVVVNNNAAAVILALNALALGREVVVSRGELIEIGGAFRLPEIMARAGCRLREVGSTNRTHPRDYEEAIGPDTALLMKAHTSNYVIQGFASSVSGRDMAAIARRHGVPSIEDLGSGTLVDLERWGLPHEPTVRESIEAGVDLVTFSGDKLLGGPQVGIVAGRKELVARLARNPLKRALRVDKIRLAALEATLRLYLDPDRLARRLPTIRLLARPRAEIEAAARRLAPVVAAAVGEGFAVEVAACRSQIGSGALPMEALDSAAVRIVPRVGKRAAGSEIGRLAARFRALPVPVVGRVEDGALVFDLRCLEDEAGFAGQLAGLGA